MHRINWPIVALIIANVIWGASMPVLKLALENIPVFSFAFIRFLIACLVLYPFVHKRINYPDLKNKWLWLYAVFGISINIAFFFWALQRTTSINATIIASTAPIMVLIGSAMFLREKFKLNVTTGVFIALAGAIVIIFQPLLENGLDGSLVGNLLMIIATLGAVLSTICGRKFLTAQNSFGMTFWACLIGCLTFFPFMLREFWQNPAWFAFIDTRGYVGIFYGAILSTVVAYTAYDWALAKLPAYKTSVFTYLDPVATIILAVPLLGEKITLPFVIGSVLIFIGILIAEKRISYHPLHHIFESDKIQGS